MPQPPTGTVTFLFTDIEGSTRLWERSPAAMRPALARHDQILREAIEANGGHVFKTMGDAFCAVFATAPSALAATLTAQSALVAEAWATELPLRVRAALHTGSVEERGGDYFGPPLNRVARLLAAAHGGQVLLSEVTHSLVLDALSAAVTLQDLGEHRLRDLGRPERIFQLLGPGLPAEFPPLRTLDNPALPNNLPQQVTSFIGREKESTAVKTLLGKTRLLTLTGAGGIGKTRLALQAAADLLSGDGDGVWLVELAPVTNPALVPQSIADVLGVRESAGGTVRQALLEWLRPKHLLIVLDNCEHLLPACASLAADLLRHCPGVRLLASSREPLNVSGERVYRVPSLGQPDPRHTQTVETLSQYEAVRLFIERAQAARPAFTVTNGNAPAVAQVCSRLDGIPLAIELAAARVRSLSAEEVNARLDDRFRLLTGGARTALPRQQTLRAMIDWSYDLLTDPEKTVLCRLSVFAGGWSLPAAAAVCPGDDSGGVEAVEDWEVLDLLTALADKSLVAVEMEAADTRYRLLETVRQYAAERLQESGGTEAARAAHLAWCAALAAAAEPHLQGPEQGAWLARLEDDLENLRVALAWGATHAPEAALWLASDLTRFWVFRGHASEGRAAFAAALAATDALVPEEVRLRALREAAFLANAQGDHAAARPLLEQSLDGSRARGDRGGEAMSLGRLGEVLMSQGDFGNTRPLLEEALALNVALGDSGSEAENLGGLGYIARMMGDYAASRTYLERAVRVCEGRGDVLMAAANRGNLACALLGQGDVAGAVALFQRTLADYQRLGNRPGQAWVLASLSDVERERGDAALAVSHLEEALAINRDIGSRAGESWNLSALGAALASLGDAEGARRALAQARLLCREIGNRPIELENALSLGAMALHEGNLAEARALYAECLALALPLRLLAVLVRALEACAALTLAEGAPQRSAHLLGAAQACREAHGTTLLPDQLTQHQQTLSAVRGLLGDDAFAQAWAAGRVMTLEEAARYATEDQGRD